MILLPSTRQRIARVPLLWMAHDCVDELGIFARSFGQKVYQVHTRAGVATAEDQTGRGIRAPSGMPRISVPLIGGVRRPALVLEPGGTNAQVRYDDLADAAWTKTNCSIVSNIGVGFYGKTTLDKIVEDGTTNTHSVSPATFSPTANRLQSVTVILAPGERTWCYIQTRDLAGTFAQSWVDLANVLPGTVSGSHRLRLVRQVDGLVRIEVTWNANAGASTCNVFVGLATGNNVSSYAGDGASGLYFAALQRESDAETPSSIIPTAGASASRAADSFYFPVKLTPRAFTMYVRGLELMHPAIAALASTGIAYLGDAAFADAKAFLYRPFGEQGYRFQHDPATATSTANIGAAAARGDTVELRGVGGATGTPLLGVSINGADEATNGPGTAQAYASAWSAERFWFNSFGNSNIGAFGFTHAALSLGAPSRDELRDLCEVG